MAQVLGGFQIEELGKKYIICSFLIDTEYLSFKRNNKIKDYFHKSTRFITNQLVSGHYNTVIIGYNKC